MQKQFKIKLIILLLNCLVISSYAQNLIYNRFTTKDGLASNETYQIASAKNGYLWINTDKGLSKFDGKNFTTYNKEDGLSENKVEKIFVSPNGVVWVLINTNLFYFNNKKFIPYQKNKALLELYKKEIDIISIYFENEKPKIIGTSNYGFITIEQNKLIKTNLVDSNRYAYFDYNLKQNILFSNFNYDLYDKQNAICSKISNKNITKQNILQNTYFQKTNIGDQGTASNYISVKLKNGNSIVVINKTIISFSKNNNYNIVKYKDNIVDVFEDSNEDIWFCLSTKGVLKYSKGDLNTKPEIFFKDENITSLCQDFEKGYWLTTFEKGIIYLPNFALAQINIPTIKQSDMINCITSGGGNELMLGCNKTDLHILNNNKWKSNLINLKSMDDIHYTAYFIDKTVSLNFNSIYYDSIKDCIATTHKYCSFAVFPNKNKTIFFGRGSNYSIINKDTIAIATNRNSLVFQQIYNKDTSYLNNLKIIKCTIPTTLYKTKNNIVWVGLNEGIGKFEKDTITQLLKKTIKSKVSSITELSNGTIVAGTIGKGIYFILNNICINNQSTNDKKENIVNKIIVNNDTVWCATQAGIVYFDAKNINNIHRLYLSPKTSFMVNDIKDISYYNGNIYCLSDNNIYKIQTNKLLINNSKPFIELKNLIINDSSIIAIDSNYKFKYKNKKLRFEYDGIAFKVNKNISYQYCLQKKGEEIHWQTTSQAFVELNNVDAGDYIFNVRAINDNNITSNIATYQFTLPAPIWEKWWFYALCLLAISLLFYFYNKKRINKIHDENKMRELMLSYEQQALASQINPHFIFNVITNIQSFVLTEDKKSAYNYLNKFAKLMRLSLDNSRLKWVLLKSEIELINLYLELEKIRFAKFEYKIDIDKKINIEQTLVPSMLIQPFLENSIKHGIFYLNEITGLVTLKIYSENNSIICDVEDNGVGRARAKELQPIYKDNQHKSAGQSISQKRMQLLMKEINQKYLFEIIDKPNSEGTIVKFYLPFENI